MRKAIIIALSFVLLFAASCENEAKHVHQYSKELVSDENQHYYFCECGDKKDAEDHIAKLEIKEATCLEEGEKKTVCSVCGRLLSVEKIAAKGHVPAEEHVIVESTCAKEGSDTVVCSVCNAVISTTPIAKKEHTPGKWEVIKEATCGVAGVKELYCSVCKGVIKQEEIQPTGTHTPGEWQITKQATCTLPGTEAIKCSVCGNVIEEREIKALGHKMGDWRIEKPTCGKDGVKTRTCSVCGKIESEKISATENHSWTEWTIDTVTETRTRSCTVCGKEVKEEFQVVTDEVMKKAISYEFYNDYQQFQAEQRMRVDKYEFSEGSDKYFIEDMVVPESNDAQEMSFKLKINDGEFDTYQYVQYNNTGDIEFTKNGVDVKDNPEENAILEKVLGQEESMQSFVCYEAFLDSEISFNGKVYIVKYSQVSSQAAQTTTYRDVDFVDKDSKVTVLSYHMEGLDNGQAALSEGGFKDAKISRFVVDGEYYMNRSVEEYLANLRNNPQPGI